MKEYSPYHDEDWARKYMFMHWKDSSDKRASVKDVIHSSALDFINRMLRNCEM